MWPPQFNLPLRAAVLGALGLVFMLVAQGWRQVPASGFACTDSITAVNVVKYGSCDVGQTISYMRDLDGARYIICRCHATQSPSSTEDPETPDLLMHNFDPSIINPDAIPEPPKIEDNRPDEEML